MFGSGPLLEGPSVPTVSAFRHVPVSFVRRSSNQTTPKASVTLILHELRNCGITHLEQRFYPALPEPNSADLAALTSSAPDPCPDRRNRPFRSPASSADRFFVSVKSAYLTLTFRVDRRMYSDAAPGRSLRVNNACLYVRSVADHEAMAYVSYRKRPHVADTAPRVSM
jgi:hypothetical protein